MLNTPLTIDDEHRPKLQGRFPAPHVFTAVGCLLSGSAIAAFSTFFPGRSDHSAQFFWLCLGVGFVLSAVGVLFRKRWARALLLFVASVGAFYSCALSLAAFYPFQPLWWPGALFALFCIWSLFFAVRLWPEHAPVKPAA